jgi:pyruvate formate lyase activating enzyme
MREAMLYERVEDSRVRCNLCAHRCIIADGSRGICQVRENDGGKLYTEVYGKVIARHIDPVEKKPLYHFYPGSTAYSIATAGCNFRCQWCQNADISQMPREQKVIPGEELRPEQIVAAALRLGCRSIAYTYTEPTIFFEYAYDTSKIAAGAELANVIVTNGYMTEEMLELYEPVVDAANVDLKAFRNDTYRKYVGARLQPVLDSMKKMKELGIWLEVTTLVIPGVNDDAEELTDAAGFIVDELGPETPWHLSGFYPAYKMRDVPPTPAMTLQQAAEIGKEAGLRYVYRGNVPGESNTTCHACGQLLIRRSFLRMVENHVRPDSTCPECGTQVSGVGMAG